MGMCFKVIQNAVKDISECLKPWQIMILKLFC